MKTLISLCVAVLITSTLKSQTPIDSNVMVSVFKNLSTGNIAPRDSVALYSLNLQLEVVRGKSGTIVKNISANDKLAFSIFPNYEKLKNLNYSLYMGGKNEIILVIPVLLISSSPEHTRYKDKDGNALINFNAAANAAFSLYNPSTYDNIGDGKEQLDHVVYKAKKKWPLHKYVIVDPITIDMTRINDKILSPSPKN
ncbi:MAG: hypothetical protein AAGB30_11115 [Pedobacter sp.]